MSATIAALATAPGTAAVAVIRVSGPSTRALLLRLGVTTGRPRRSRLVRIADLAGEEIDRGLVIFFPAPNSYTGEDVAELHLHGSRFVAERALAALLEAGARLAEPGEFTRRAFEGGKLDLDQAEAVADLIDAESAAQARQALSQLRGSLGRRYLDWRQRLTGLLARIEAAVDFPDEDIALDLTPLARDLGVLREDMALALADARRGLQIRDGFRIALVGAPNAGKSTLFNALVGRDAAIVTPEAGTTRDIIEAALEVGGYRVLLADMAGLRPTQDLVEREGVRRARAWAETADLRLWVVDASATGSAWREGLDLLASGDACVLAKADLRTGPAAASARHEAETRGLDVVEASALAGGVAVASALVEQRCAQSRGAGDAPAVTRLRHRKVLEDALEHLDRAQCALATPELAAEDLRLCSRELARIQGRVGAEEVLDQIFSTFCIGK